MDVFWLSVELLADFNGDGIGELLLQRHLQVYAGSSCHAGSGNFLGESHRILVKKDSLQAKPVLIPFR